MGSSALLQYVEGVWLYCVEECRTVLCGRVHECTVWRSCMTVLWAEVLDSTVGSSASLYYVEECRAVLCGGVHDCIVGRSAGL
jgi:hypothetical protein